MPERLVRGVYPTPQACEADQQDIFNPQLLPHDKHNAYAARRLVKDEVFMETYSITDFADLMAILRAPDGDHIAYDLVL